MGLEVVVNEIVQEGRKQAKEIERQGEEEAKAILDEARAKAEAVLKDRREAASREAARVTQQEDARMEFEAKRQVLTAKRRLWERLRKETQEAVSRLPEEKRRQHLQRLIGTARAEIPEGTIHVRKEDEHLLGDTAGYDVVGDLDADGGLVVEDPGGTVSLDLRFETLLDDLWPQVLKEESRRLFG